MHCIALYFTEWGVNTIYTDIYLIRHLRPAAGQSHPFQCMVQLPEQWSSYQLLHTGISIRSHLVRKNNWPPLLPIIQTLFNINPIPQLNRLFLGG